MFNLKLLLLTRVSNASNHLVSAAKTKEGACDLSLWTILLVNGQLKENNQV